MDNGIHLQKPLWSFDEELLAVGLSINDPLSVIEGTIMDGASTIPGGYNQFDVYPDEYKGRFFREHIYFKFG